MQQMITGAGNRVFLLRTQRMAYAFAVHPEGFLTHLHWGGRIDRLEDLPSVEDVLSYRHRHPRRGEITRQEYPGWGGEYYGEPALKAHFPDGARCALLKYRAHSIRAEEQTQELVITLEDSAYPLEVNLHYRIHGDLDLLERWSEIRNRGAGTLTLNNALSAVWHLPKIDADYRLSHLSGRWGKEHGIERQSVNQSKIVLESRTGLSGPFAEPFFAVDKGRASEEAGRVWFGTLHWSGNWKIAVERDGYEQVGIAGGIHDFDFSWPLPSGESFTTPIFCAGISEEGFGGASRILHAYQRNHLLPRQILARPMPLLFNSWASMGVEVNEQKILQVAAQAAEVGAELFVIDDGWQAALGDWAPDPVKFPQGLKPIIERVKRLGMDFGLWVEVESFERNSQLYADHPEWAMTFPGREIYTNVRDDVGRTSMQLNFARPEVAEYIYGALRELIASTGIRYLKLDMNCYFTNPGWESVPLAQQQTIWVQYVRNLYDVFRRLNMEFPEVLLENCAAGAGRSDLGMNRFFARMNRSDNQDTLDILRMHEGFTWLHLSRMAGGGCHISDAGKHINLRSVPMQYQAYTGLMGSLAIGKNLPGCTQEERDEIRSYAELYKRLRHIPQEGDLYRLVSHYDHPYAVYQFVSQDRKEALLVVLGHAIQFAGKVPAIQLRGMAADVLYEIEYFGNWPQPGYTASLTKYPPISGKGLMEIGIRVELLGDYDSRILYLKAM